MARHDLSRSDAPPHQAETRASLDDLIRPSLRRAFPLPSGGDTSDERFHVLLKALARRDVRNG